MTLQYNSVLTIDCKDVLPIRNDLLVYVSDQIAAIPTLKKNQFTLSAFDEDEGIDIVTVVAAIREFLDSIDEGRNFTVLPNKEIIHIKSVSGKAIDRQSTPSEEMFSCTHCGFITRYQTELNVHMRIHYF